MQTKNYKVAGHLFQVTAPEGAAPAVFTLMDNYSPFEVPPADSAPLFTLEISTRTASDSQALDEFVEETRQDDEGQEILCGKNSRGESVLQFFLGTHLTGVLVSQPDFGKSILYFGKALPETPTTANTHLQKFALNNSLMILYALTTAGQMTALFHSAVIDYQGKGYMFLGKSGTGKSTHARMWLSRFKDANLLNDDNPVVRFENTGAWVYGSPWSGKTPCYKNRRIPLQGIIDLSQAPQNKIRPIKGIEAYMAVMVSISGMRWNRKIADGLHATENRLAQEVKMYHLDCLPDENAAEVCYEAASGSAKES